MSFTLEEAYQKLMDNPTIVYGRTVGSNEDAKQFLFSLFKSYALHCFEAAMPVKRNPMHWENRDLDAVPYNQALSDFTTAFMQVLESTKS